MKRMMGTLVCVLSLAAAGSAPAALIQLWEIAFRIDGVMSNPTLGDPLPSAVNWTSFDRSAGLGTITIDLSGPGDHYVGVFFDHDVNGVQNRAEAVGAPGAGQTWEIDEPGYIFGDIYGHLQKSALDSQNAVSDANPGDASMAMGWRLHLSGEQTAELTLLLTQTEPSSPGFCLVQRDLDESPTSVFLSGLLSVSGVSVPDPGASGLLLGLGSLAIAGCSGFLKRRWGPRRRAGRAVTPTIIHDIDP
jgi:hypothetical protein